MVTLFVPRLLWLSWFGALLVLSACGESGEPPLPSSRRDVQAEGKGAIAAGRDVVIDKSTVVNEYDVDQARKIEAGRFARTMNRECVRYVDNLRTLEIKREKGSAAEGMPGIFSPVYASPDTQRIFGDEVYAALNAQQEELKNLSGSLFTLRQQHAMASAYEMMAKYDNRERSRQLAANNPVPTQEQFLARKTELMERTQAHCKYLQSLM